TILQHCLDISHRGRGARRPGARTGPRRADLTSTRGRGSGRVNEGDYLRLIRGQTRGPLASVARAGLAAAAVPYGLAVRLRNLAFDRGWRAIQSAGVPVISVGNLTLGGTGKTPMVEWIARWFQARGVRVALLSRGYGQNEGLNDEGRVLEENLPDVPHL